MSPPRRELRREPYKITVYLCLGCGEQYQRGRDGVPRCQNRTDLCGSPVALNALELSPAMREHLGRAHRLWEEELHARLVAVDERAASKAAA